MSAGLAYGLQEGMDRQIQDLNGQVEQTRQIRSRHVAVGFA